MGEGMQEKKVHKMPGGEKWRFGWPLSKGTESMVRCVIAGLALLGGLILGGSGASGFARAAELVFVEQPGCPYCRSWEAEIGDIYPKTDEAVRAPLRRVTLGSPALAAIATTQPVVLTPTFLLVEDGVELGRVTGYGGEDLFWWQVQVLMKALP